MAFYALLTSTEATTSMLDRMGQMFAWMGERVVDVVAIITAPGNELMLIGTIIFLFGGAIGLGSRLIGR